jgi:hypothetical protein
MARNNSSPVQQFRGTTAQHATYTGLPGELTVDTDKNVVVVHDGVTAGGHPMTSAAATTSPHATKDVFGLVKIGANIDFMPDGSIGVRDADKDIKGVVYASDIAHPYAVPVADQDGKLNKTWLQDYLELSGGTMTGAVAESLATPLAESGGRILDLTFANNFAYKLISNETFEVRARTGNSFQLGTLVLTNGGAFTVTWPSSFKWADGAPPSLMASGIDVITFFTIDGGVTYYAAQVMTGIA